MSMDPNEAQPNGTPGYPPPPGAYSPPPPASSLDIQALVQRYITVLRNPGVATFSAEAPYANWQAVWIGLAALAVVRAIFGIITGLEYHAVGIPGPTVASVIGSLITTFVGFFVIAGAAHLLSRLFGATASFLPYAYVMSLIFVPLGIIDAVAGIIPILGGLIGLAAGIYGLVLWYFATIAVQRVSQGQAIGVMVLTFVAVVILTIIVGVILGTALALVLGVGGGL